MGWLIALTIAFLAGGFWAKDNGHIALQYLLAFAATVSFGAMMMLRARREEDAWRAAAKQVVGTYEGRTVYDLETLFGDAPWTQWKQLSCIHLVTGQGHRPPFWILEIEYGVPGGESWKYYRMTFAVVGLATVWSTSLRPEEPRPARQSAQNGRFLFMWSPQRWTKGRKLKTHELPGLLCDARALALAIDAERRTAALSSKAASGPTPT